MRQVTVALLGLLRICGSFDGSHLRFSRTLTALRPLKMHPHHARSRSGRRARVTMQTDEGLGLPSDTPTDEEWVKDFDDADFVDEWERRRILDTSQDELWKDRTSEAYKQERARLESRLVAPIDQLRDELPGWAFDIMTDPLKHAEYERWAQEHDPTPQAEGRDWWFNDKCRDTLEEQASGSSSVGIGAFTPSEIMEDHALPREIVISELLAVDVPPQYIRMNRPVKFMCTPAQCTKFATRIYSLDPIVTQEALDPDTLEDVAEESGFSVEQVLTVCIENGLAVGLVRVLGKKASISTDDTFKLREILLNERFDDRTWQFRIEDALD